MVQTITMGWKLNNLDEKEVEFEKRCGIEAKNPFDKERHNISENSI